MTASLLVAGTIPSAQAEPEPTGPVTPSITTFPQPEDPDALFRAALTEAKKQNKPVAVEAAYTESSRTWAYPDGHLSTQSYNGPAQLRRGKTWDWIDTTLIEENGVLRPRLAKAGLRLSPGGTAPFASIHMGRDSSFGLSWPTALPKPQIKGNVATYAGVAGPSADLVVTALPTGFRHDVVLRERPAGPVEFRLPVQAQGVKLAKTKSGALTLSDDEGKDKGEKVASAPAPRMWDAAAAKADAKQPGREAKVATDVVKGEHGETVLVLKPDATWLADPATQYPVTVDPTTTLTVTQETSVLSPNSGTGPGQVGRSNQRTCPTPSTCGYTRESATRALLAFDTAPISGRHVVGATMQLSLHGNSTTCSSLQAVTASLITEEWDAEETYWGNQPATRPDERSSLDPCTQVRTDGAIWSWNLTAMAQAWATGTANHGLQLRLGNELPVPKDLSESYNFWAQMWGGSRVPKLSVDWVLPPAIPTVTAESIDSMSGNDAIARSTNVKVTYKSSVPEATNLDYTVTVNDSTMAPPAAQLPTGEAAWWKLDETSGTTAADATGKGFTANLSGAYSRVPGQLGQAVKLSPGGQIRTGAPVLNTNQSYTVTAWVRLDSGAGDQAVFSQMGTNQPGFSLGYLASNAAELDQRWILTLNDADTANANPVPIGSKKLAGVGRWTHLAAQYDATDHKIRLYVDGELNGERDHTAGWNARGAFVIGRGTVIAGDEATLDGAVDDVHAYQRVLTGDEIRSLVGVPGTTTHNNIPSGQTLDKVFTLDNPASFKFVVKACRSGLTRPSCNESPAYRITSDAPVLPSDTETGMAEPGQPILSGMVHRPSGGPVIAKYYLYDNNGLPIGSAPLGSRTANGGERASFQIPANTVQAGRTYKWQMVACVTGPQDDGSGPEPTPTPTPTATPTSTPTPSPTPTPTPTPSGLVAAYGMNEGTGDTIADPIGGNDGSAFGTTWVTGKYGKALSFNGTYGTVDIDDAPSLRLGNKLTLSAWVKPSAVDSWHTVIAKDNENIFDLSYGLYAAAAESGPTGWFTINGQPQPVGATSTLTANTWAHLAVTYDGTTARLYRNGTQIAQENFSGSITNDAGLLHIGGNGIYGEYFKGVIDEVRIYNRAQTAAEITTDMNTPLGGTTASSVANRPSTTSARTSAITDGSGVEEVCTPKTPAVSFTTPGTPPPPPTGDVRHLTLGKDSFVIKTARTDPTACSGSPCTVTDDSRIRIGGTGADKTAAIIGFRLDELPDDAVPVEALLDFGTPTCSGGSCSQDTPITITRLDSPVTNETTIGTVIETTNDASKYSVTIAQPKVDVIGDQYSWLLVKSDNPVAVTFAEPTASTPPSLKIGYTPAGPPSKVQDLSGQPGDGGVIVSWAIPASTGSLALLEGYDVEAVSSAGESVRSVQTTLPSATITGLTNGEAYTIKVAAKTRFGKGEWESISLTPRALPPPPAGCESAVSQASLKVTVQEYYLRQSGVVEGTQPDVWSSSMNAANVQKQSDGLDPHSPITAKVSLTNPTLLAEREGLEKSNIDRTGTSVSLSNTLAYTSPDGTPTLRATVSRSWTDTTTDKDGNQLSKPSELTDTFDYSFTDCGAVRLISVVVDVDVSDMDMILEGPGPDGCGSTSASARGTATAASSQRWCGKGKNGDTVFGYTLNCDFGQDICRFDTYGKQNVLSGMSFESGGVLRWSGVHNYTLGGPTSVRIEELQGWSMVKMTSAFKAANKNIVKNIKIKLATTSKFSMTVGSISVDTGVGGVGFSKTNDSTTYSVDGEAGNLWVQIPVPGKIRPFTVECEGILGLCWFDSIRHAMNVTVQFPMKGGPLTADPMNLQSCWFRASTKYF
ncbi:LamG-like jellyroll fold domain-containing protein [Nonomuraea wenchangensis]